MIYTLIKLLLARPALLAQHAANYADVFRHEVEATARQWVAKVVAGMLCALCLFVALILAGVALMVGLLQNQFQWVLVIVPAVPLLLGLLALVFALRKVDHAPMALMREQFAADMAMFAGKTSVPAGGNAAAPKTGLQPIPPTA